MSIPWRETRTQKILLISILGVVALIVYTMTDIAPFTYKASAAELEELSGKYRVVSSDLTKARQTVNSLSYLEKEFDLLHAKWNRAQRMLPDKQETASLLRAITLLGEQSGVAFHLYRPQVPVPAQFHTEHPVEVKVEGGYHEIATFLNELANMERIVTVSDLTLDAPKPGESDQPAIASFVAKTYTLGGTGLPPEQEGEKSKGKGRPKGSVAREANRAKQTVTAKVNDLKKGEKGDE